MEAGLNKYTTSLIFKRFRCKRIFDGAPRLVDPEHIQWKLQEPFCQRCYLATRELTPTCAVFRSPPSSRYRIREGGASCRPRSPPGDGGSSGRSAPKKNISAAPAALASLPSHPWSHRLRWPCALLLQRRRPRPTTRYSRHRLSGGWVFCSFSPVVEVVAGQFGPGRERGRGYPFGGVGAGPPTLSFPPVPPRVVATMVALANAPSAVAAAAAEAVAAVDRQAAADGVSAAVGLAAVVTQLQLLGAAVDVGFLTLAGVLVCPTMQTGFAMLTAGSVRAKNVKSVLMKVLMDTCVGGVAWMLFGYVGSGTREGTAGRGAGGGGEQMLHAMAGRGASTRTVIAAVEGVTDLLRVERVNADLPVCATLWCSLVAWTSAGVYFSLVFPSGPISQECVCVWGEGQRVFGPLGVGTC